MPLIPQENQDFLRDKFASELTGDVTLTFFTQRESKLVVPGQECMYCGETRQLLEEVTALSPKLHLEIFDFVADSEKAKALGVDKIPAVILNSDGGGGIRFYGIPSGYEFASLIEDIIDVSQGEAGLADETKESLKAIDKDIHIQVFGTPT